MASSVFDPQSPRTAWTLRGHIPGERKLLQIPIDRAQFVVGRQKHGVHLRLKSGFVSNQHAELSAIGGGLQVRDLCSRNGTFVHGRRISGSALVSAGETIAFADIEFRVEQQWLSAEETDCNSPLTQVSLASLETGWTISNFAKLLQTGTIVPHFQPILSLADAELFGFEALARSEVDGLKSPSSMFEAAEILNQVVALSRACRQSAIDVMRLLPRGVRLFLNTHPAECLQEHVLASLAEARQAAPEVRLVVEIHEEFIEDGAELRHCSEQLAKMGVELALDDFGAGRSRLKELVRVRPAFVKFDREMISNLDRASAPEREGVRSLVEFLHSLSILAIAEGIERLAEAEVCRVLGFDLGQGFYFARPMDIHHLAPAGDSGIDPATGGKLHKQTREHPVLLERHQTAHGASSGTQRRNR